MHKCMPSCWAMPDCTVCGLRKPPYGRSVAPETANSYCGWDCPGYQQEPRAGHLWPNEEPDAGREGD